MPGLAERYERDKDKRCTRVHPNPECITHVTNTDCVVGCRRLARTEAILAGGSSGGVISAIERMSNEIPEGSTVVALLPDRGERYLDSIYSDEWVRNNLGDIAHHWTKAEENA